MPPPGAPHGNEAPPRAPAGTGALCLGTHIPESSPPLRLDQARQASHCQMLLEASGSFRNPGHGEVLKGRSPPGCTQEFSGKPSQCCSPVPGLLGREAGGSGGPGMRGGGGRPHTWDRYCSLPRSSKSRCRLEPMTSSTSACSLRGGHDRVVSPERTVCQRQRGDPCLSTPPTTNELARPSTPEGPVVRARVTGLRLQCAHKCRGSWWNAGLAHWTKSQGPCARNLVRTPGSPPAGAKGESLHKQ